MKLEYIETTKKGMHRYQVTAATAAEKANIVKNGFNTTDRVWSKRLLREGVELVVTPEGEIKDPEIAAKAAAMRNEIASLGMTTDMLSDLLLIRQLKKDA